MKADGERGGPGVGPAAIRAVTLDFGNTLVPVRRDALERIVGATADRVAERHGLPDRGAFLAAWAEERERQFREDVPDLREVDVAERVVRVLARLRGIAAPPADVRWDDEAAARLSDPQEVDDIVEAYGTAFVAGMARPTEVGPLLERLAGRGLRLAILSNWPLAWTIERYAEEAGWTAHLEAVVVSQRVGVVKPHPAIFAAARAAVGDPEPAAIVHVGDDWAADVAGARAAGWRTVHVRGRPADSPLPGTGHVGPEPADIEIESILDLEAALDRLAGRADGPG